MKKKLQYAQEVLAGIVTEDFTKIKSGARNLITLCESVGWTETKSTGRFKTHDKEFREVVQELVTLAKDKNLEGIHYKYNNNDYGLYRLPTTYTGCRST